MLATWTSQPCSRRSRTSAPAQRNSASSGWASTLSATFAIAAPPRRSLRLRHRALRRRRGLGRLRPRLDAPLLGGLLGLLGDDRLALLVDERRGEDDPAGEVFRLEAHRQRQ